MLYILSKILAIILIINMYSKPPPKKSPIKAERLSYVTQSKVDRFCSKIQAGSLALSNTILQGYMLLGFSQMGKTTSAHQLCNSPLQSIMSKCQLFYKTFQESNFKECLIGDNSKSKTEVPNSFQTTISDRLVYIQDQPGFGDIQGLYRIVSNGFFHYQSFSKIKNLKFILVIDRDNLKGLGEKFHDTFKYFLKFFKNYDQIKLSIIKATCLLVTKVESHIKVNDLKEMIEQLKINRSKNMKDPFKSYFVNLIDDILAKNKIFIYYKPTSTKQITTFNKVLLDIDSKTAFWSRSIIDNKIDMKNIQYSVSNQILDILKSSNSTQNDSQQFSELITTIAQKVQNIFMKHNSSLKKLIKDIQKDAKTSKSAKQSLNLQKYFSEISKQYYKFEDAFQEQRNMLQQKLFGKQLLSNQFQMKATKTFFIQKIKTLQQIRKAAKNLQSNQLIFSKSIYLQTLIQKLEQFIQITAKQVAKLAVVQFGNQRQLNKYFYSIFRAFEQFKILIVIMFQDQNKLKQFTKLKSQQIGLFLIHRNFKDNFLTELDSMDVQDLKFNCLQNLNTNLVADVLDPSIIQFLESAPTISLKAKMKISKIIINHFDDVRFKASNYQATFLVSKMLDLRQFYLTNWTRFNSRKYNFSKQINFQNGINTVKNPLSSINPSEINNSKSIIQYGSNNQAEKCHQIVFEITKLLGGYMTAKNQFKAGRALYRSISDYYLVLELYKMQLQGSQRTRDQKIKLLMDYGIEASHSGHSELALSQFQLVYSMSTTSKELRQSAFLILTVLLDNKLNQEFRKILQINPYIKGLYNDEYIKKVKI